MSGTTKFIGTGPGAWFGFIGSTLASYPGRYRTALQRRRTARDAHGRASRRFARDGVNHLVAFSTRARGAAAADLSSSAPTLFTALEKQAGLKLVKTQNVPVEVLVIDHIDKTPTEN